MSSFPSYDGYRRFLEAHLDTWYEEGCYYQCSMSIFGEGPVSEGYTSDIDLEAPDWFRERERRAQAAGMWTGKTSGRQILEMLLDVDPECCYPRICQGSASDVRPNSTLEFMGWRLRVDEEDPPARLLEGMSLGSIESFTVRLDQAKLGRRRHFSLREEASDEWMAPGQTVLSKPPLGKPVLESWDGVACVLGVGADRRFAAAGDSQRTFCVRAFRLR